MKYALAYQMPLCTAHRVPLNVEEVVAALERNGALDVKVIPLAGKSDLAEAMICCTGKSQRHMQVCAKIQPFRLSCI